MFRLVTNIGGFVDLYTSRRASHELRVAALPTLAVTGLVGDVFVERLRFARGGDYGRNRYLLLLTRADIGRIKRLHLKDALEEAAGQQFDRLMGASNRAEVEHDCELIYDACVKLDTSELPKEQPKVGKTTDPKDTPSDDGSKKINNIPPRDGAPTEGSQLDSASNRSGRHLRPIGGLFYKSSLAVIGASLIAGLIGLGVTLDNRITSSKHSLEQLTLVVDQLSQSVNKTATQVVSMGPRMIDQEREIEALKKITATSQNAVSSQVVDLGHSIESLERSMGQTRENIHLLQKGAENFRTRLQNMENNIDDVSANIVRLTTGFNEEAWVGMTAPEESTSDSDVGATEGQEDFEADRFVSNENEDGISEEMIAKVQQALNHLGFEAGKPDGTIGTNTRTAILAWERGHQLEPTGELTSRKAEKILREAKELSRSSGPLLRQ